MAQTRDVGRFFAHTMRYPETGNRMPRLERAETREVEYPYRRGSSFALRVWSNLVLVLGRWGKPDEDVLLDDDETDLHLSEATESSTLDVSVDEIREWPGPHVPEEEGEAA